MAKSGVEKALNLIKNLPRVQLNVLQSLPGTRSKRTLRRGKTAGRHNGRGSKGQGQRNTLPRIGFEGNNTPFYLVVPKEPYYYGHHVKKHYTPVSLLELQRMIDLGHINPDEPIDLSTFYNTGLYRHDPASQNHGIHLTDEGADKFAAQVNVEVQWSGEQTIAAVERAGGVITNKFYDRLCVVAMTDPLTFFNTGKAIPRVKLPSQEVLEFYSDPASRGYLADPEQVSAHRQELAQKYGYKLADLSISTKADLMKMRKDPRQMWYGLSPGALVNLRDKKVLYPTDEKLLEYYKS